MTGKSLLNIKPNNGNNIGNNIGNNNNNNNNNINNNGSKRRLSIYP